MHVMSLPDAFPAPDAVTPETVPRPATQQRAALVAHEDALLTRAKEQHDMEALGEAWQSLIPVARHAIDGALGKGHQDSDDLMQGVALRVVGGIDGYIPGTRPASWVSTIAHNLLKDRTKTTTRPDPTDPEQRQTRILQIEITGLTPVLDQEVLRKGTTIPQPSTAAEADDSNKRLSEVLALLPEDSQDIVRRIKLVGLTNEEYGAEAGISPDAVRSRLYRALKNLRALTESGVIDYDAENRTLSVAPVDTAPLEAAIDQLPVSCRGIVRAVVLEGMSTAQYAEITDRPVGSIINTVTKGKKLLDKLMSASE